eukprot:CCRYP_016278-RA/>CCRYP_016278-RA protein AED:0.37 eAED:0.37 QI:147/1/1/1/1/1/6/445/759
MHTNHEEATTEPPTTRQPTQKTHSETSPLLVADIENGSKIEEIPGMASSQSADATPSWSEAFAYVSPYLRPRDRHHSVLAFLALLTVLLEKLVNILPPLAIRHAVDAISAFASVAGQDDALENYSELQSHTANTVTLSIIAYFTIQTINSALSSLQSISQRAVSLDAERRFASALFSHLHLLGPAYHLERHAGELLRILSRGSDATSTIIDSICFNLLPTLFEACVVATVFCKFGVASIALSTIVAVTLYLMCTLRVTNTRMSQRRQVLEKSDEVGRIETETLVNYETVVMFGREQKEVEEYDAVRKEYTEERVNMLGLFAWLQLGQQTIRLGGTCIGLWLAGRATVYGTGGGRSGDSSTLSPGSFVVVQLYIQQLFQPLSYLGFTYRQITEAFTDLEKAVKCLKSIPSVKDSDDAVDWEVALQRQRKERPGLLESSGDIKFDNVSFRYKVKAMRKKLGGNEDEESLSNSRGGRRGRKTLGRRGLWGNRGRGVWAGQGGGGFWLNDAKKNPSDIPGNEIREEVKMGGIQNVTFHIPAGQTAALVGPSGSGKTTIIRLLLRMYDPDAGSVMVDDINVKSLLQQSLRSNIGVVAQDTVLFHASLRDNITYGKEDASDDEIWDAVRISALEPLVKSLPDGLETLVGERGMKLSGGERQRVGLARCIIKKPKLVLLDEATSALDSGTEREIQRNILTRQTAAAVCKGRTTLMIAHRLSTARRADVIIVLDKGEIIEKGTHEELLKLNGKYASMWRDQNESELG